MVSENIITRLQAMKASGEVEGYLCSQISKLTLEANWIIQGLTYNGLKGRIDTEKNQRQFLGPMDSAVRLMIDEGIDPITGLGIVILGPMGLTDKKFVVLLRGFPEHQEALAFQTSGKYNPQDIFRLIIKYELNEKLDARFTEPNSDYVEQLRIDSSEDKIIEALSLKIPKSKFHAPDWIRDASTQDESEYSLFRYGELNQIPPFSLLFSSWCIGLSLSKNTRNMLVSMTLLGEKSRRAAIWDAQRKVAFFAILRKESLEEIARKYLLSLWSTAQEKVGPPIKTREVVIGSRQLETTQKIEPTDQSDHFQTKDNLEQLQKTVAQIQERIDDFSISELLIRLETIESQLTSQKSATSTQRRSESQVIDSQSQERLKGVISRLEAIAKRLEELDNRIEEISSMKLE